MFFHRSAIVGETPCNTGAARTAVDRVRQEIRALSEANVGELAPRPAVFAANNALGLSARPASLKTPQPRPLRPRAPRPCRWWQALPCWRGSSPCRSLQAR